jgi:uncharacterized membrane protein YraQ (UPF0718 family)
MIVDILLLTLERFLSYLPVLLVAIVTAKVINLYMSHDRIGMFLKAGTVKRRNIMGASLLGLITPGPLAAYLPVLKVLQSGGLPLSIVATFITSQTLVGPIRVFLEVDVFGPVFFAFRVAASFIIAIAIGVCFQIFSKHIKPKANNYRQK